MAYKIDNREVDVTEVEGAHSEGAYATDAYFIDTDEQLTDEQLDTLNDKYSEELYEHWYMQQVMRAESLNDIER